MSKGLHADTMWKVFMLTPSISITTGPSDTAQTIGSKFTLKCTVAGRTDSDAVIWRMYNKTSGIPQTLTLDTIEKNPDQYTLETGGYNLVVKKATTDDDTVFECEAGESKAARVYIYGYGDVTSFMPFTPTSSDVDGNINVRCEADLYIKKNVMSVSFGINGMHSAIG
ncbi:hypothetical protein EB796_002008 [Bugula neritina]|uniref:Ig-like domain-containing protein n=1 Tax=Bugula neritina TaxID=10212 RepID=A0A7J7KNF6_BUGNE|nr:hypothetical protein EB796_002008 [Bugula neritina]